MEKLLVDGLLVERPLVEKLLGERLCSRVGWVSRLSAVDRLRVLGWLLRLLLALGMAAGGHWDHLWPTPTVKFGRQKVSDPGFSVQNWALQSACQSVRASGDPAGRGTSLQVLRTQHSLEPLALQLEWMLQSLVAQAWDHSLASPALVSFHPVSWPVPGGRLPFSSSWADWKLQIHP